MITDTDRIDWIAHWSRNDFGLVGMLGGWFLELEHKEVSGDSTRKTKIQCQGKDLREVIDRAMQQTGDATPEPKKKKWSIKNTLSGLGW